MKKKRVQTTKKTKKTPKRKTHSKPKKPKESVFESEIKKRKPSSISEPVEVEEKSDSILRKLNPFKKKKITKITSNPIQTPLVGKTLTGISGFDQMTQGGFDSQSINLIAGGSGSGKTIFALQFLIEGIKKGETVLYVTFEEKKSDFYRNMKKFGWDLLKAEKTGKFIFLEYSPEKVKMMLDEGGGSIENTVLKYQVKRMVIDSITSFTLMFDKKIAKRQAILGLFDIIRKWDCTTLLTVQHNPSSDKDRGMSDSEFEADSITLLYNVRSGNSRERLVEILKMRGTDHSKSMHVFKILKGGIKVGPKTSVRTKKKGK